MKKIIMAHILKLSAVLFVEKKLRKMAEGVIDSVTYV